MWGGLILCGMGAVLTQGRGPASWGPFLAICAVCVAGLVWSALRRRQLQAKLPKGLKGLWYRASADRIEFLWRWSGDGGRLRILRSDSATIRSADDATCGRDGIVCVHDGHQATHDADEGLRTGTAYRYAFFVGYADGRWSRPVRQTIAALSAEAAAHVEATLRRSAADLVGVERRSALGKTLAPDALWDPHGTDVEWGRSLSSTTPDGMGGLASIASQAVSSALVDGVFDLIDTLPSDKLRREGWVEVV